MLSQTQKRNLYRYGTKGPGKGNSNSDISYQALGYQVLRKDPVIRDNFWYVVCYKDIRNLKVLTLASPSKVKIMHLIENYLGRTDYEPMKGKEVKKHNIKVSKLSISGKMKKWPWYPASLVKESSKFNFRSKYRVRSLLKYNRYPLTQYHISYRAKDYVIFSRFDKKLVIKDIADYLSITERKVRRKIRIGNYSVKSTDIVIKPSKYRTCASNYNIAYHIIKCEKRRITAIHNALIHVNK